MSCSPSNGTARPRAGIQIRAITALAVAGLIGSLAQGCEPKTTTPAPGSAATASVTVSLSGGKAQASTADPATPPPIRGAGLAALPPDGMLYGVLRPAIIDHGLAAMPVIERIKVRAGIAGLLGRKATDGVAMARALTIDDTQPVFFALVSPPPAEIARIVDGVAKAPAANAQLLAQAGKQASELDPPLVQLSRVTATLTGPNLAVLLKALEEPLKGKVIDCGSAPECKAFEDQPAVLFTGRKLVAAAYVKERALTVDIAHAYFLEPTDPKVLKALDEFHRRAGGPQGRCASLDLGAAASLCVDADQAGQFGTASGLSMVLGAVSGTSIDPTQAQKIVKVGKQEAEGAERMAQREPRLLDDGTLAVRGKPGATEVEGSWATTKASDDKLRQAFEKERCVASGEAFAKELLPELAKAFGTKPVPPAEAAKQWEQVQEAGWAAWPVIWGRAWPHYVPLLMGPGVDWTKASGGKSCVRYQQGRLEIEGVVDLSTLVPK
ncbi:MAG: hypothetical protein JRI68_08870 [Deltaproteobacteria bacterium]|nr:hypothetical protein [Deltaproteobacteria bacterium]